MPRNKRPAQQPLSSTRNKRPGATHVMQRQQDGRPIEDLFGVGGVGLGPMGPPGFDGADGVDGDPGPPGVRGLDGVAGAIGPAGAMGAPGAAGDDGAPGDDGFPGPIGPTGSAGATGSPGFQGPPGLDGDEGEQGDDGLPGPIGPTGSAGAPGAMGPQGVPGMPGLDGDPPDEPLMIPGPAGKDGAPGGGSGASGSATLNFGAWPGSPEAQVDVIGQAGVVADSKIQAWVLPIATADHSADEHLIEALKVLAVFKVAGEFTIRGYCDDAPAWALRNYEQGGHAVAGTGLSAGGGVMGRPRSNLLYGQWTIGWRWS